MSLSRSLLAARDRGAAEQLLEGCPSGEVHAAIEEIVEELLRVLQSDPPRGAKLAKTIELVAELTGDARAKARARWVKGHVLKAASRSQEALEEYDAASAAYAALGLQDEVARIAIGRVNCLTYLGRYHEAIVTGERAREFLRETGQAAAAARMDLNLGNVYHRVERPSVALDCFDRALKVARHVGDPAMLRVIQLNRGVALSALGRFEVAEKLLTEACEGARVAGEDRIRGAAEWNLGYIYFQRGEYGRAYDTLDAARRTFEVLEDFTYLTHTLVDLTELLLEVNNFSRATDLAAQARRSAEKLGLQFERGRATLFEAMAALGRDDVGEAEDLLQEASRVFDEEGNAPSEALCGTYRAELALRRGAVSEAHELLEHAAATFRAEKMRLHEGSALLGLASVDLQGERLEASRRRLDEAASALRRVGSPWLHARLSHLRGRVAQAGGTRGLAIRHYRRAVEKIESIRGRIGIDEFRISFVEDKAPIYADLVGAILESGKPESVADAFSVVESARSRALVDLLAVRLGPAASKADEGSERLLGKLNELRAEINRLSGFERPSAGERRGFRRTASSIERLHQREAEMTEAMRRLERHNAHLGALTNGETTSLVETQRGLPKGTTLVEYFLGRRRSWAFVVTKGDARIVELPVRPEDIQKAMLQFRFQIERGNCGEATTRKREQFLLRTVERHLTGLSELIWRPLEIPEGAVIVVPHGPLHSLPFAALPLQAGEHVLDRHRLSYLPSASCRRYLREAKVGRRARTQEPNIVVVEAGDENIPEVRREVEEVRRAFRSGTILRRGEATRERFREAAREADIIHIATHGIFRGDDPSFSSLRLADGWMSLYDIYGLALDAELVSLSACQSGRSWVGLGDELVGLSRGFLYAGASALVVTLWPVHDRSTADLMTEFYRGLSGGAFVDESLRRAMQQLRAERAHPYYWAPFVSVGGCGQRVLGADEDPETA